MDKHAPRPGEELLSRKLVDALVAEAIKADGPLQFCATFPVMQAGPDTRENPIRLKNMQQEAARRLKESGASDELLAHVDHELLDQHDWERLRRFPALWLRYSPEETLLVGLPERWSEQTVVGNTPWVRPLIQSLAAREVANILCLSRSRAWTLRWASGKLQPLSTPGFPVHLEEVVGGDREQPSLQHHSAGRATQYHGQGINLDDDDEDLARFAREVAGRVERGTEQDELLRAHPLWLAATDEVAAVFNKVSSVLTFGRLTGSPDDARCEAWAEELALRHARYRRDEADALVSQWLDSQLGSDRVTELVGAASAGRVQALVVAGDTPVWGRLTEGGQRVECGGSEREGTTDLLDHVLAHAWATGGEVHAVPAGLARLQESGLAGLLRYRPGAPYRAG